MSTGNGDAKEIERREHGEEDPATLKRLERFGYKADIASEKHSRRFMMKRLVSLAVLISFLIMAGIAFAEEAKPAEAPAPAAAPAAAVAEAPKIDTGDTAWMIVATALVMLMTIPGLALFYGGLAKRKDSLNTMAMSFVTFCIVSLLWVLYGFSFSFNGDMAGFIGDGAKAFLNGVSPASINDLAKTIPEYIFIVYQMTFAAITVALASGAYIERMKFSA